MHSGGGGKIFGVMVVVCSPPSQEELKHGTAGLTYTEWWRSSRPVTERGMGIDWHGKSGIAGIALMFSPMHQHGAMTEAGHKMLWGTKNRMMLSPSEHGWLLVRSIFGGAAGSCDLASNRRRGS